MTIIEQMRADATRIQAETKEKNGYACLSSVSRLDPLILAAAVTSEAASDSSATKRTRLSVSGGSVSEDADSTRLTPSLSSVHGNVANVSWLLSAR